MKLAAWIAALICLAPAVASAAGPTRTACSAAAAAIAGHQKPAGWKVVVIGIADDAMDTKVAGAKRRPSDWGKVPPPAGLVRAWAAAAAADILRCPAVQSLLAKRGIASGPAAAEALSKDASGKPILEAWGGEILSVGMPVVSADGRDALVEVGSVCGGLCGSGFLLHLRRVNGAWTLAGSLPLWIS